MDINKNISSENTLLPSGKGQNNFSVPTDYFDFLPEKIMDRIHLNSQQKKIFFLLKPIIVIPSLAVLSGIIVLLFFFPKDVIPSDEIVLSDNEVQQIIDDPGSYNIDEASITEQYLASNIPYETVNEEASVSDEEIKSYLEDNSDVAAIIN